MTAERKTRLRATLGAAIAFLIAYGPELLAWLGAIQGAPSWVEKATKALGIVVGLATTGRAVLVLNLFLPEPEPETPVKPTLVPPPKP